MKELIDAALAYCYGVNKSITSPYNEETIITVSELAGGTQPIYSEAIPGDTTNGFLQTIIFPVDNLGYGADFNMQIVNESNVPDPDLLIDFSPDFHLTNPNDPETVAQAIYRRITTDVGVLRFFEDDNNYGVDIISYLQKCVTPKEIQLLPNIIKNEILKDDRIIPETLIVKLNTDRLNEYINLTISGFCYSTSGNRKFNLVMNVSDLSATIVAMK